MYKENGKVCFKCNVWKDYSEFHKKTPSKDGYNSSCGVCKNTRERELLSYKKPIIMWSSLYKICPCCNIEKIVYQFPWKNLSKGLFGSYCKECKKEKYYTEYVLNSIDERLAKGAKDGDIVLYLLKFTNKHTNEIFYKIGITKLSVKIRYSGYTNYKYSILSEYYFDEDYCTALETKLVYEHRNLGLQYTFHENESFSGHTECFIKLDEDVLSKYLN